MARLALARKVTNDLLGDFERLLVLENDMPDDRRQDVIHPSEMAKSDWCPRATYLRILAAREGRYVAAEAHRFQTENIFEEGHEYHRKWQARARRMNRLQGQWMCEACEHKWFAISPVYCPECGAPGGALTYHEVPLSDPDHLIYGKADGEVVGLHVEADDVLIEIKSIGEGTVRNELPAVLRAHTHEVDDPKWPDKVLKVLDHRGVWKDINQPFKPHLRQGLIYLRLRALLAERLGLPEVSRILFIYEYKPTSLVKAFWVERNDDLVQGLWDSAADIVYALDQGGRPPACIDRKEPCKECAIYEGEKTDDRRAAKAGRGAEEEPARRRRPREAGSPAPAEAEVGATRVARRPDRPRGRRPDGPAREVHEVGGLLGRPARGSGRR